MKDDQMPEELHEHIVNIILLIIDRVIFGYNYHIGLLDQAQLLQQLQLRLARLDVLKIQMSVSKNLTILGKWFGEKF